MFEVLTMMTSIIQQGINYPQMKTDQGHVARFKFRDPLYTFGTNEAKHFKFVTQGNTRKRMIISAGFKSDL